MTLIADPPGPPEIRGYSDGETVRLGQTVNLICESRGGNPLAEIEWFKNGNSIDRSFTTSGRMAMNSYQFRAATDDHNAKYACEARNYMSPLPAPRAEVHMTVFCK